MRISVLLDKFGEGRVEDHTLERLCRSDRARVVRLVKHITELQRRAGALDAEIGTANELNQSLQQRGEELRSAIEMTEARIRTFEAVRPNPKLAEDQAELDKQVAEYRVELETLRLEIGDLQELAEARRREAPIMLVTGTYARPELVDSGTEPLVSAIQLERADIAAGDHVEAAPPSWEARRSAVDDLMDAITVLNAPGRRT